MIDEENYDLYTIEDILNRVDGEYLDFIAKNLPKPNKQRTIYGNKISENLKDMAIYLKNETFFRQRFSSLSDDARDFLLSLYARGGSISLQPILEKDDQISLKNEVQECLDKLMIFGLSSKTDPEVIIMPLEYAFFQSLNAGKDFELSLANLLKQYPKSILQKISGYYGFSYRLPVNTILSEIFVAIMKNFNTIFKKLNSNEKKIVEYMISNRGVAILRNLLQHFNIKRASSYYYYEIQKRDLLSPNYFLGGEVLMSLIRKGLIFCSGGPYYHDDALYAIIPDEILWEMRKITNDTGHQELVTHEEEKNIHIERLKNYGYDLSQNIKKICLTLYYLELRSQRGTDKAIWKIISIPESEFRISVKFAIREGLIMQNKSYLTITPEGEKRLEEPFFGSKLHNSMLIEHIFSYYGHEKDKGISPTDLLRQLYLTHICNVKTPEKLGDMFRVYMSNNIIYNLLREMEWNMIKSSHSYRFENDAKALRELIDAFARELFYELVELLKMYNFIRLSSAELGPETLIFPEKQLIEVYENLEKLPVREEVATEKKPLKILPNNEILMEIDSNFKELKEIARFANLVSADVVCTFRITKESLSKYMNNSGNLDEIREFLRKKSPMDIPDTIKHLIDDMDSRKNEIEITKCQAVLQVKDRTIIDGIMAYKSLSDMIEKRLTPEILVIKEGVSLYRFVTEVRKKGYIIPVSVEKETFRRRSYHDPIRW